MKTLQYLFVAVVCVAGLGVSGCYYDVEEELYPDSGPCDTTAVTYSQSVVPILNDKCNSCHNASKADGLVILDSYAEVMKHVNSGALVGSITWDPNYSRMPKNQPQLSSCSINTIKAWVNAGAPNN